MIPSPSVLTYTIDYTWLALYFRDLTSYQWTPIRRRFKSSGTIKTNRIEADINRRAENLERETTSCADAIQIGDGKAGFTRTPVNVVIPSMIQTPEALGNLIQALESHRNQLASAIPIRITRRETI